MNLETILAALTYLPCLVLALVALFATVRTNRLDWAQLADQTCTTVAPMPIIVTDATIAWVRSEQARRVKGKHMSSQVKRAAYVAAIVASVGCGVAPLEDETRPVGTYHKTQTQEATTSDMCPDLDCGTHPVKRTVDGEIICECWASEACQSRVVHATDESGNCRALPSPCDMPSTWTIGC